MVNPFLLLGKTVAIDKIYAENIDGEFVVDQTQKVNWRPLAPPKVLEEVLPYQFAFNANNIMLKHLNIHYTNKHTNNEWRIEQGQLLTKDIRLRHSSSTQRQHYTELLRDLSIHARLRAKKLIYNQEELKNINISIEGKHHHLALNNLEFEYHQGHGSGEIDSDFTSYLPRYQITGQIAGIESLPKWLVESSSLKSMDISLELKSQGHGLNTLKRQAHGTMDIHVLNGGIKGLSLKDSFDSMHYAMSQNQSWRKEQSLVSQQDTTFDHINLKLSLESGLLKINHLLLTNNDINMSAHGTYNLKNNDLRLQSQLTLLNKRHAIIQEEFNQFFRDELINTLPMTLEHKQGKWVVMPDLDYIDVNKLVLGNNLSQGFKKLWLYAYRKEQK